MWNSPDPTSSHLQANQLAFAPFAFQAARFMRDHGVLQAILDAGRQGITLKDLAEATGLSDYAIESVCEAGLSFRLVKRKQADGGARYTLAPVGYLILTDRSVRVNMDFTHHVCYRGLFHLEQALLEGRPAGLSELGDWPTIYEGLSKLPDEAREAWFAFDHYYSDTAMPQALPHVLASKPRNFLDIGGNTGRASRLVAGLDSDVAITIADLPGQIGLASKENAEAGIAGRVDGYEVDLLDPAAELPRGFDVVWMSQFLVCFSKIEIVSILERARRALAPEGRVWILDTYWDHTQNGIAAYCLHGTSLYFTAMANGNSRMYSLEDTEALIERAGMTVVERVDGLGRAHTLLACEPT